MYLKKINLFQFKNHKESGYLFCESVNCFIGKNGAGKTNILDGIHYLSQTKSYFNYIDSDNINFKCSSFSIQGTFVKDHLEYDVRCGYSNEKGKNLKLNDKFYKKFSDHIGKFPVIIISPTDTNLIIENSDVRRKYIDISIAQTKKDYLQNLINYNKILKQRNYLLKQFQINNYYDETSIAVYNNQLAKYGEILFNERKDFIRKLTPIINKYYELISNNEEDINLEYKSQLLDLSFEELIKQNKEKERYSNFTLFGPHKDDVVFKMNNFSIKKTGSQGQQKTFLIALKLAQFEFLSDKMGFKPILLLDDIFDKLDENRIAKLINFVSQNFFGQVFITDTNLERCNKLLKKSSIKFKIHKIDDLNTNE